MPSTLREDTDDCYCVVIILVTALILMEPTLIPCLVEEQFNRWMLGPVLKVPLALMYKS